MARRGESGTEAQLTFPLNQDRVTPSLAHSIYSTVRSAVNRLNRDHALLADFEALARSKSLRYPVGDDDLESSAMVALAACLRQNKDLLGEIDELRLELSQVLSDAMADSARAGLRKASGRGGVPARMQAGSV